MKFKLLAVFLMSAVLVLSGCVTYKANTPAVSITAPPAAAPVTEPPPAVPVAEPTPAPSPPSAPLTLDEVFLGYRKAVGDSNLADFKKYSSFTQVERLEKQLGQPLTQENFKALAATMSAFLPIHDNVKIDNAAVSDAAATWTVSDKTNPNGQGTIEFVKESGIWKLYRETWSS